MRKCTCLFIAMALMLTGCAAAEPDPVVVSVGDVSYTLSQAQASLDAMITLYSYYGMGLTEQQKPLLAQEIIEHFIGLGIIECKLRELGLDAVTDEDEQALRKAAQGQYETLWQQMASQVRAQYASVTDAQITEFLSGQGFTLDAIYDEMTAGLKNQRILQAYCPDITVTAEQCEQYYQEQYITPSRERYENNIPLYENEILVNGGESFYVPSGYRRVKQILLAIPKDIQARLDAAATGIGEADKAAQSAYEQLAALAAAGEDTAEAKAVYNAAKSNYIARQDEYEAIQSTVPQAVRETTDAIYAALAAGASFESQMTLYSTDTQQTEADPGYLFHASSEMWATAWHDAAVAMIKPGEVSQPVVTGSGVHILYYASDVESGAHQLTAEEYQTLEAAALQNAQTAALERLVSEWRKDYTITTDASLLKAE